MTIFAGLTPRTRLLVPEKLALWFDRSFSSSFLGWLDQNLAGLLNYNVCVVLDLNLVVRFGFWQDDLAADYGGYVHYFRHIKEIV